MTKKKVAANGHTFEHLMSNLARANEVRARKKQLREDLAKMPGVDACRELADRLVNDPAAIGPVKVEQLLMAIQGVGRRRAHLLAMAAKGTSLTDRADRLPEFRRVALAHVLLDRAEAQRAKAA